MLKKNKTFKKNFSKTKSKKLGLVARAGGKVGGKLPQPKWKMAYLAVLAVFVLTLGGAVGLNYYNYKKLTKISSAGVYEYSNIYAKIRVCKYGAISTGYGLLIPIVVITDRKTPLVVRAYADIFRKQDALHNYDWILAVWGENLWWAGLANRTLFYVSYNFNDQFEVAALGPNNNAYTQTPRLGLGSIGYCPAGL